jgi:hypothetical protein
VLLPTHLAGVALVVVAAQKPGKRTCHMHDNLAWRRRVHEDATTCTVRWDARFALVLTPGKVQLMLVIRSSARQAARIPPYPSRLPG